MLHLLLLALLVILFSLTMGVTLKNEHENALPGLDVCTTRVLTLFTMSSPWCGVLGIIAYEFVVYPLFGSKLPSTLRRIGIVFIYDNSCHLRLFSPQGDPLFIAS